MEKTLTKQEAIEAMKEGKKVTHQYFSESEWMTMQGCVIIFEDGVSLLENEFWRDRDGAGWESGYSIKSN